MNILRRSLIALMVGTIASVASFSALAQAKPAAKTYKIFHVMSFKSPFRWTDGQLKGFKEGLGPDVQVEYQVFQMDIGTNSKPDEQAKKGEEARAIIESWKPDLVYTTDDAAFAHVTKAYANKPLPFVFSGLNKTPAEHGVTGASNVAGVLEQEHFVDSVKLLQQIKPEVKRIAVITDTGAQWPPVIQRIKDKVGQLPGTTIASVDVVKTFEEFKAKYQSYATSADAVVQLGVFGLMDETGAKEVPYQTVQRWVIENTKLPEVSFWIDRVNNGVLAGATISEQQQGIAAGKLARAILVEGKSPASLPMQPSLVGNPAINTARAKELGLTVKSSLMLSSEVVAGYDWKK